MIWSSEEKISVAAKKKQTKAEVGNGLDSDCYEVQYTVFLSFDKRKNRNIRPLAR